MKAKTDLSLQVSARAAFEWLDYYCTYSSVTHLGHVTNTQHGVGMAGGGGSVGRCCGTELVPTDRSAKWKQDATGREVGAAERSDFTP